MKQTVLTYVATPGSGKTFLSRELVKASLHKEHPFVHINTDLLRSMIFAYPKHTREENQEINKVMTMFLHTLLDQGYSVIYDTNNNSEAHRRELYEVVQSYDVQYRTIHIKDTLERCLQRNRRRAESDSPLYDMISEEVLRGMKGSQELPKEKWERVLVIDRSKEEEFDVGKILKEV